MTEEKTYYCPNCGGIVAVEYHEDVIIIIEDIKGLVSIGKEVHHLCGCADIEWFDCE